MTGHHLRQRAGDQPERPTTDDTRVVIVVDPSLGPGFIGNTIACVAIGLGAASPGLGGSDLVDLGGLVVQTSATVPVPVLQADPMTLRAVLLRTAERPQDAVVVAFPAFARTVRDFSTYQATFPERDLRDEDVHGLGIVGPHRWIRSLTGSLKLLR